MTNRLSIIDTLESARKAQGLTQEELAQRAGTSRVTVGRVESGFDPKLATVYELARALGLELVRCQKSSPARSRPSSSLAGVYWPNPVESAHPTPS